MKTGVGGGRRVFIEDFCGVDFVSPLNGLTFEGGLCPDLKPVPCNQTQRLNGNRVRLTEQSATAKAEIEWTLNSANRVIALHGKIQNPDFSEVCSVTPEASFYVKLVTLAELVNMDSPHSSATLQLGLNCEHIQGLSKRFERFKFGIFYLLIVKIRYNFTHK